MFFNKINSRALLKIVKLEKTYANKYYTIFFV